MIKKLKTHLPTIFLVFVFLVGLSLLLYPTVSNYWNTLHQTRAIASYNEQVANLDQDIYEKLLADAAEYNKSLLTNPGRMNPTEEQHALYESLLDITGTGIMAYIEIPSIDCYLPIYHGVSESVLQVAVGHIEGSSLPVGGEGTHCVLSGHRGLPSARLFTDLDKLEEGDTFTLCVLDEYLTYEIDQILIVEPQNLSALTIEEGQDYCTLITCTPYGINSHRMLVRGHRVESGKETTIHVPADAVQIRPILVAPLVGVPILLILVLLMSVRTHRKKKAMKRRETMKRRKSNAEP